MPIVLVLFVSVLPNWIMPDRGFACRRTKKSF